MQEFGLIAAIYNTFIKYCAILSFKIQPNS